MSKSSCDCDDADIDKTYRMCCNHHLPSLVSKSSCDGDDADIDMTSVGRSRIYGVARKSVPDEQGYKVQ